MLKNLSRVRAIGWWLAAGAVLSAALVAFALHAAIDLAPLLLTLALGPPAVMLLVWRGATPPTLAELLHSVNADKRSRS